MTEQFFWSDEFYHDMGDFIDSIADDYKEDFSDMEDTWSVKCYEAELQPMLKISKDTFYELAEERFPEDNDRIEQQFSKALDLIPFDQVMEAMPKLYYQTRKTFTITKQDILEYIK